MTGAENRPGLVILTGPTAVGKSELSVSLAGQIGGEIISADSMQVYRHMDIGSAKIMPDQMGGIPHHLIDVLEPTEEFNVVSFQQLAKKALQDIYARGRLPVVAGGTGFYIQALLYDIDFTENDEDTALRARLEETAAAQGSEALYERLKIIDPESCESIHAHNVKRVIRAIEFYEKTGMKISEHNRQQRERTSPYNFAYFVLTDDRERLYGRIEARIDRMLEEGLVEEVAALDYLDGKATLEEAVYILKRDTRHFAKRQLTWFRRERDVIWINKKEFGYDDGQILTYIGEVLHEKGIRCSLDGTRTENKAGR